MIAEPRKARSKAYSKKHRYSSDAGVDDGSRSILCGLMQAAGALILQPLTNYSAKIAQAPKNENWQGCTMLYPRFPYQLRKAIEHPSNAFVLLRFSRPNIFAVSERT